MNLTTRLAARASQGFIDAAALSIAFWLAFALRFEGDLPLQMLKRAVFTWPYVVGFQYVLLMMFGVTRFAWRYVGLREATRLLLAVLAANLALFCLRLIAMTVTPRFGYAQYAHIPGGVIISNAFLAFLGVSGVRVLRRMIGERVATSRRGKNREEIATMLIGAGEAGVLVAKEIATRPDLGLRAVGFVDDDPLKVGSVVHGVRVMGTTSELGVLSRSYGVSHALICIANASGREIRRITMLCHEAGLDTKIIPGLYEIMGGRVNLSRIRKVAIDDLLGREAVTLDEEAISAVVRGRNVLITGAGGSIGSELCRQVCRYGPTALIMVEQAENNLFHIHRELNESHAQVPRIPYVADICDIKRMEKIFDRQRPAVVFHAAAHKHVPMMEWNPGEAVKNNVLGTQVVADLAHARGVREFVMVSTDKAVNPTSVMGATKRVAEIYVQALSQRSPTRFVAVRFGNVLGSAGSVVPIFQEQIAAGGPVTVTHPDMRRYFMTTREACQLILQAAAMGKGGEIFVLDMGEPVRITDLARDLIRLSGLKPDDDIEITFTGLRPGEKLFEEISVAGEQADKTRHPKIYIGRIAPHDYDAVRDAIERLRPLADSAHADRIRAQLAVLVPEYRHAPQPALIDTGEDTPATALTH